MARGDSVGDSAHDVLATSAGADGATERCTEGGASRGRGEVTATQGRREGGASRGRVEVTATQGWRLCVAWNAEDVNGRAAGTLGDDTTGRCSD